jgi:hypothetical protein
MRSPPVNLNPPLIAPAIADHDLCNALELLTVEIRINAASAAIGLQKAGTLYHPLHDRDRR